jgi:hypothetical protein
VNPWIDQAKILVLCTEYWFCSMGGRACIKPWSTSQKILSWTAEADDYIMQGFEILGGLVLESSVLEFTFQLSTSELGFHCHC